MRRQSVIIIGIAILLGLLAVFLVNSYLSSADSQTAATAAGTRKVAVARVPLDFGADINAQNIRFVDWPANSVPEGSFSSIQEISADGIAPVVLRSIAPGEPVLRSRLSGAGGRATLSALLPEDMRAVAIPINAVSAVAGFVLPGDRVDVLITRTITRGENEEQISEFLLQNVRVIAIDQMANDSSEQPTLGNTATLEVTPEDAQRLALARDVGAMSLALRSVRADEDYLFLAAMTARQLTGGTLNVGPRRIARRPYARPIRRLATTPPAPTTSGVEVVRGTAGTEYEVGRYRGN